MDSINEVKKEYNNLSSSEITEAKIIDEAVKELNEVVDFSNKTFRSNDIESTVKSLEFTEETLKNISKIASEEISSDMSEVKFDELKDETKKTLIEVTNNIAEKNIKVNSLSPGSVLHEQPKELQIKLKKLIPMNRLAKKNEYIGAIKFLCSSDSSYMTGQNLVIDGGRSVW